jgi:NAD(P)-dependent dehydrogenase (short-subunit alcohol dehydrogenase family)
MNYLVIGGAKGVGAAIVELLEAQGNTVYFTSREVSSHPNSLVWNIEDESLSLPEGLVLDGLVYCPGTINLLPAHRISHKVFLSDININAYGALKATQLALPYLKKSDAASVVFISTVAVKLGMPFHASVAMAKGALEGLGKSLAAELAPKIRVNVVAPSLTQTGLAEKFINTPEKVEASNKRHPLGRIGQPNDLAEAISFLLSAKSSWMTGQVLGLDGGMGSLKML